MIDKGLDLIIRGAEIYDGTGAEPLKADVGIKADRISAIGDLSKSAAPSVVDARGLALAPGFIDVHSHDDFAVFVTPEMDFKVMQGVTTDVIGNCGLGAAPYDTVRKNFGVFFGDATVPGWEGYRGYMEAVDRNPPSLNVAVLVGHNTVRMAAMGNARREPSAAELARMRNLVREGLEAGAVGFSTGLIYEPGRYARTEEVIELTKEAGATNGLYATHMRNEAARLLESVTEAIRIGDEAGVPVQISHHKAAGRENWGKVGESIGLIEKARARGLDLTADQYPYTSASTALAAIVENNAFNERAAQSGTGRVEGRNVRIAAAPRHPEYEGKTLDVLAAQFGLPLEPTARRIVEEESGGAMVILEIMDEADVRTVMRHPTTMIGSDGLPVGGKPHPRLYGTFTRVLGRYARDLRLFSMAQAVHRMTGMPATKFKLDGRGFVREGAFADLVVFDPATVIDRATYDDPCVYSEGIKHVLVNGRAVVRDGRHTGARPGHSLRRRDA